jgi:acetyltransferase-like isoleucine patch superfamily enzyme
MQFVESMCFFAYNNLVSHCPGYGVRRAYLRVILRHSIGRGTAIHMGCFVTGRKLSIGDSVVINRKCYLDGRGPLKIESNVSISPEVYILTATHLADSRTFAGELKGVTIEEDVWIGARAIILPGVTLARGSVVGAGSVVTKSTGPYEIVAGNPAKVIRRRSNELDYRLSYFPWFNTDVGG